jgi:hypothetical protein
MMSRRAVSNHPYTIDKVMRDKRLLGTTLGDTASWSAWIAVLRGAYGLPLSDEEQAIFASVAGNRAPPSRRVRELWCLVGRRGGKSRMAAALAVYEACFVPHKLAAGETGFVLVLAASKDQAHVVHDYVRGFLRESPVLRKEIESETAGEIRLRSGVIIAVHANSFRSIRGKTMLACIFDEVSFWRDETSSAPDIETYRAVLPALMTTKGILIGISTPYRKIGLLFNKHRNHFGQDGDVLVVQGPSAAFNPSLSQTSINAAIAADPEGASAEWEASFRADISGYLDDATIDAAIDYGRPLELPRREGCNYRAFVDASGGRHDHYCVAISHKQDGRYIIDAVVGVAPPFDPGWTTKQLADVVKRYGVRRITGDAYSAEWTRSAWRHQSLVYNVAEMTKSELYLEAIPLFTQGLVSLPDHPRLIRELRLLERRTSRMGRDVVDHGRSGSDDYINSVAGALRMLDKPFYLLDLPKDGEEPKQPRKWNHEDYMAQLGGYLFQTYGHLP